jgi:hypothetical protein
LNHGILDDTAEEAELIRVPTDAVHRVPDHLDVPWNDRCAAGLETAAQEECRLVDRENLRFARLRPSRVTIMLTGSQPTDVERRRMLAMPATELVQVRIPRLLRTAQVSIGSRLNTTLHATRAAQCAEIHASNGGGKDALAGHSKAGRAFQPPPGLGGAWLPERRTSPKQRKRQKATRGI